jgi:hypothetical protein
MVKKGDYKINNLYEGRYSTLSPETYSPSGIYTGYRLPSGQLGAPTKPDTANQLTQVNMLLNQGIIPIEVGALNPEVFDAIPKEHFKEINRMAKLTGADISVHAPLIEASGIGEQGWSEAERQLAEQQLMDVVERTAPMNEKGGMSINVHSAVRIPGVEYTMTPEGAKEDKIYVVNRDTGKVSAVFKSEEKYYPGREGLKKVTAPRDELDNLNATEWDNSISQLMHHKEDADTRINENIRFIPIETMKDIQKNPEKVRLLGPTQREAYSRIVAASHFIQDAHQSLNGLFNKAYKFGTKEDKEKLKVAADKYKKDLEKNPTLIGQSQAIENLTLVLQDMQPQTYQTVEDFALDKSAKTFANVAFHALEKYKDKAPTLNIENVFPGMAFSHSKELNQLIKRSREELVDRAIKKGYSKSKAEREAERIIGITLDVGHLNLARKKGYKEEDLMKEVAEIAKNVKHVHLTDNFGYGDTHLPPGMGNVPFKEIFQKLEQEGFEGKKIVEAGGWVQHFGTSPLPYTLEAFGSPTYEGGPYWNQTASLYEGYSGGFGRMLPQVHYETFGAGFSQLPTELGGQRPGAQGSRMSGKPME